MIQRPKISSLIPSQLPEFVRDDYPLFVAFLQAYYDWLETQTDDIYTLRDVDTTLDSFLQYIRDEVAVGYPIPYGSYADARRGLAHSKGMWLAKGSPESYNLLFKLLYNKPVDISYPSQQMLVASDGRWQQDTSIFVSIDFGNPSDIVGKIVDVLTSTATLKVLISGKQNVEIEVDNFVQLSPTLFELSIDRAFFGTFNVGDKIQYGEIFSATILGTTSAIDIKQGGSGFTLGQMFPIVSGSGKGSLLKVKRIDSNGSIQALEFVKFGIGYSTDFVATLTPQTNVAPGLPPLEVAAMPQGVTSITVTNGGSGYSTPPTAVLSEVGETQAGTIGSVVVVGGVVTAITVATYGYGYPSAPNVIITGGSGTGAAATANLGNATDYTIRDDLVAMSEQGYINQSDYAQDLTPIWMANTNYAVGDVFYWAGLVYTVTVAGKTGTTPPAGTSGQTNGTTTLTYTKQEGGAFDGTYAGAILREFFGSSTADTSNPAANAIVGVSLGSLARYPGYYTSNNGFLDDAIVIQDSFYYQAYSYVLKIDEKLETFASAVKTLVHPAGMKLFGEYGLTANISLDLSLQSIVKILVVSAEDLIGTNDANRVMAMIKALTDPVTPADSVALFTQKPLTDNSTLADALTNWLHKNSADGVSLADGISAIATAKALTDNPLLIDPLSIASVKALVDSIIDPTDFTTITTYKYNLDNLSTTGTETVNLYYNPYSDITYWSDDYNAGVSTYTS